MPARHAAETLQRHQRDAEVAHGRQLEEAGAEAVIDSAHQDDQGDEPPDTEPEAEADGAASDDQPTNSKPDGSAERPAPAEAPAGLARIRTAAANATSRLLGVTRAIGGGTATASAEAERADHDGDVQGKEGDTLNAGMQPCWYAAMRCHRQCVYTQHDAGLPDAELSLCQRHKTLQL